MKAGDVVLIALAQIAGGPTKLRPALLLAVLPGPYQNCLICGISTQLKNVQPNWDERIKQTDAEFAQSGLHHESIVRLSYLYAAERTEISGTIGKISPARLGRLRARLAQWLQK